MLDSIVTQLYLHVLHTLSTFLSPLQLLHIFFLSCDAPCPGESARHWIWQVIYAWSKLWSSQVCSSEQMQGWMSYKWKQGCGEGSGVMQDCWEADNQCQYHTSGWLP